MSQASAIEATVSGNVSGQVAVGHHILQLGNVNGGIVNVALSSTQLSFKRRGRAVNLRPRRDRSFLDRGSEVKTIKGALKFSKSVLVVGAGGIGKTALLHQAAHLPQTRKFRDGVVLLEGSDRGLDDVLQFIFQTFYESRANVMPTEAQTRQNLIKIDALILIDNLRLSREEITVLLDILPKSTFILSSRDRTLWGDQTIISLGGLPDDDAVKLFEREFKRRLNAKDRDFVRKVCVMLGGNPLRILRRAAWAHEMRKPIAEIQSWIQQKIPDKEFLQSLLETLDEKEKSLLATLGAAGRAVIPLEHLKSLSKDKGLKKRLKKLMSLRLIQAHSPRYSLTDTVADSLAGDLDLSSWEDTLIDYFVNWLAQQPAQVLIEESADAIIQSARKAGEKEQWEAVIRIGRGLERVLALYKRWQAWADILNLVLKAAKALGDPNVEAWALHQLGCHAMCFGLADQAQDLFRQALNIRQSIGDQDGLAVTQHNLDTLLNPPMPKVGKNGGSPHWLSRGIMSLVILIAVVTLATATVYAIDADKVPAPISRIIAPLFGSKSTLPAPLPSPTPAKESAPTGTPTIFITETPTPTPNGTLTPTATGRLTITATWTTTLTFTPTPSRTPTPTRTRTPTPTPTGSRTAPPTITPTRTPTWTPTITPSVYVPPLDIDPPTTYSVFADPTLVYYISSVSKSACDPRVMTIGTSVKDSSGVAEVWIEYVYVLKGSIVGKNSLTMKLVGGDKNDGSYAVTLNMDDEANKYFDPDNGLIEYQIYSTDAVGNSQKEVPVNTIDVIACP